MKVWITKYALSVGIKEAEAETFSDSPNMVRLTGTGLAHSQYFHGKDWHRTQESALKRADEMRIKKIASLHAQIAKLEKRNFAPPEAV